MRFILIVSFILLYGCSSGGGVSEDSSVEVVFESDFIEPSYRLVNHGDGYIEINVDSIYEFSIFVGSRGSFNDSFIELHLDSDTVFIRFYYMYDGDWILASEGYSQIR